TAVQLYLQVTWANGGNYQTNYVRADRWTSTFYAIDGNGLLSIGSVDPGGGPLDQGGIWIEVHAYFSYMGSSYDCSQIVRGVYSLPTLDFISIKGPTSITGPAISPTGNATVSGITFPTGLVSGQQFYLTASHTVGSTVYNKGLYKFEQWY